MLFGGILHKPFECTVRSTVLKVTFSYTFTFFHRLDMFLHWTKESLAAICAIVRDQSVRRDQEVYHQTAYINLQRFEDTPNKLLLTPLIVAIDCIAPHRGRGV